MVRRRNGIRRALALFATALVAVGAAVAASPAPQPAQAANAASFDPGNIISDSLFFDGNAMSQSQIQTFLNQKIGNCVNSLCLNVYTQTTASEPAAYSSGGELICSAYQGAANESAAAIIFKVQQACRVSAKVLLVTLQKEQSLVTHSGPSLSKLARAMGYACPDNNGGVCDASYYGFFNQMINAAWQLRRYGAAPPFGNFQPGWRTVQWNPDPSCGASQIFIANRATAALYNYTPYRPNAAALANLYGTGDGCSSYGNRNFWVYYTDWFGNTTMPAGTPEGNLTVTPTPGAIGLSGWAVDPDSVRSTVTLSIQLDQTWHAIYADKAGASRDGQFPGAGNVHDFSGSIAASPGSHVLCVYLLNAGGIGGTGTLGCQTVEVPASRPSVGAITSTTSSGRTVTVGGWVVDPERPTTPVPVALNYGSTWVALSSDLPNADAPLQFPGAGPNQGFSGSFQAAPGVQTFCIWAGRQFGPAVQIGCRTLLVSDAQPMAAKLESVKGTATGVDVSGYAVWPSAPAASVPVAINIGSSWYALSANQPSPSAEAAAPGSGPNHGFKGSISLTPGTYNVCAWASNQTGGASLISCSSATVAAPASATRAAFESATGTPTGVDVSGWAVWPSSPTASVPVAVNVGTAWYALSANQPNPGGEAAVPGAGPNHGFRGSIPLPPGSHSVCVWVSNAGGGATQVGCQTASRSAGLSAFGEVQLVQGASGGIHYEGWAVQPATPTVPVAIALDLDGTWIASSTGQPNATAQQKFAGAGPDQGFAGLVPANPGQHSLCVWAASPAGPTNLGCKTVTVAPPPPVVAKVTGVTASAGSVLVEGWAVHPASPTTPVGVAVNIGTAWYALPSDLPSTATAQWVLGAGPNQGFAGTVPSPSGVQQVCVWVTQPAGQPAVQVSCTPVSVP